MPKSSKNDDPEHWSNLRDWYEERIAILEENYPDWSESHCKRLAKIMTEDYRDREQ